MNQATAMPCHILRVCHHSGNRASTAQALLLWSLDDKRHEERTEEKRRAFCESGEFTLALRALPPPATVNTDPTETYRYTSYRI